MTASQMKKLYPACFEKLSADHELSLRYVRETNELDGTDDGSDWREQRAQDLRDSERDE
jgi:hypothetical protein